MKEKDKRTKPPAMPQGTGFLSLQDQEAAAPASSHSTKRKTQTPAVGGEAQEVAASSRPHTKSTTPAVGREARQSKTPAVGGDARASSHTKSKTRSSHSARTRSKTPAIGRDDAREAAAAAALRMAQRISLALAS